MHTMIKMLCVFLIFFMGTTALVHVDRQCSHMVGQDAQIMETIENTVENTIEKYASLL